MKTDAIIRAELALITPEEAAILRKALEHWVKFEETAHFVSGERREDKDLEMGRDLLDRIDKSVRELANE